jgi:hypothetical protein
MSQEHVASILKVEKLARQVTVELIIIIILVFIYGTGIEPSPRLLRHLLAIIPALDDR